MPKDIKDEQPITLAEVQEIIKKREEDSELTYVQQVTLEYTSKFSRYPLEMALKLKEELMDRFKLPEKVAIQIVNLKTPINIPQELNIIFEKTSVDLKEEQKVDLIDFLKTYIEKTE